MKMFGCWAVLAATIAAPLAMAETTAVTIGPANWQVPTTWKSQPPANQFRVAQWEVPAAEGEKPGLFYVSSAGGGVEANLRRWVGQFQNPKEERPEMITVADMKIYPIDITGRYVPPPFARGEVPQDDYRLLGAVVVTPQDGELFFRLQGSNKTVSAQKEAFMALLKSAVKR